MEIEEIDELSKLKELREKNFPEHNYICSFTPLGEVEENKTCYNCKKLLTAKKFKSKHAIRNGVKGIARNEKCRKCETINIDVRKNIKLETLESVVETLTQDNEKIKQAFSKAFKSLRQDMDDRSEEIRILTEEIRRLKNPKSISTRNIEDFSF